VKLKMTGEQEVKDDNLCVDWISGSFF